MKLVHLSDLHLGKRVNGFSMLEDQAHILEQILRIVEEERPEAVLIAGDIYDASVPCAEAVSLFDAFLVRLAAGGRHICVVSGNHDSPERMAFGGRLLETANVHVSPVYSGAVAPVRLEDEYGPLCIYLLPFLKPAHVRRQFPEASINGYTDAVGRAIEAMAVEEAGRNVLVTHQFVTGAARSESEEISLGGADNVDAAVFAPFDYAALGHLHSAQNAAGDRVRYCGAPLAYSFSEAAREKSLTVVELGQKGNVMVRTLPLMPLRRLCAIRGTYQQVTAKAYYENTTYQEDYMRITLTDEEDVPEAMGRLRAIYHNLMQLDYDNRRTRAKLPVNGGEPAAERSPLELFCRLYEAQNNQPMSPEQQALAETLIQKIWEVAQP